MAAINNAAAAVGILTDDGVVIVGENKITNKLLAPAKVSEKIYKLDDHICCVVAGRWSKRRLVAIFHVACRSDSGCQYSGQPCAARRRQAQVLVRGGAACRAAGPQHVRHQTKLHSIWRYAVVVGIYCPADRVPGLRPYGVAFLYAGWDRHFGFQLYQSDPSGNYGGWKATAIGNNSQSAQSTLKSDYKEGMSLDEGLKLAIKVRVQPRNAPRTEHRLMKALLRCKWIGLQVITKAMDTTSPSAEKLEALTITRYAPAPANPSPASRCDAWRSLGLFMSSSCARAWVEWRVHVCHTSGRRMACCSAC